MVYLVSVTAFRPHSRMNQIQSNPTVTPVLRPVLLWAYRNSSRVSRSPFQSRVTPDSWPMIHSNRCHPIGTDSINWSFRLMLSSNLASNWSHPIKASDWCFYPIWLPIDANWSFRSMLSSDLASNWSIIFHLILQLKLPIESGFQLISSNQSFRLMFPSDLAPKKSIPIQSILIRLMLIRLIHLINFIYRFRPINSYRLLLMMVLSPHRMVYLVLVTAFRPHSQLNQI